MLALTMTDVCKALEVLIFQIKNIFALPVKDFQGLSLAWLLISITSVIDSDL